MTVNEYCTIKLYCDCGGEGAEVNTQGHNANFGEVRAGSKAEARIEAKRQGWTIARDGRVLSPACKAAGRDLKPQRGA